MSNQNFDLIHYVVRGPYCVPSRSGYRFFLNLVDDCNRFCGIFLMKNKSDVHYLISKFCAYVTNRFSCTIKQFRSDNIKELIFADYFSEHDILH